jgi:hypothetical protein
VRILFLANPVHDYLQDAVYHGLVSLLGVENVIEYPPLDRYHSPPPNDALYPHVWFDFPEPPRAALPELVGWADAVVLGSLRPGVRSAVDEVLNMTPRPPIALLDGEDDPFVLGVVSHLDFYFKREILTSSVTGLPREVVRRVHSCIRKPFETRDPLRTPIRVARASDRRLIPLPLAWIGPLPVPQPAEFDVAFLSGPTSPVREVVRRQLEQLRADGLRVRLLEEGERLGWHEYTRVLAGSRIGVSVRGGGYDTYRYWETPAVGSALIAEPVRIVIPENFESGREAVFAEADQMAARIRQMLGGDVEAIAAAGRLRLEKSHTSLHRARTVLSVLGMAVPSGR